MKFFSVAVTTACVLAPASAFVGPKIAGVPTQSSSSLQMVLEKPAAKKISKLETLKVNSNNLVHPLKEVSFSSSLAGKLYWFAVFAGTSVDVK